LIDKKKGDGVIFSEETKSLKNIILCFIEKSSKANLMFNTDVLKESDIFYINLNNNVDMKIFHDSRQKD
jgi:hypothetical protein